MKKLLAVAGLVALASLLAWPQLGGTTGANPGSMAPPPPRKEPATRTLTGIVFDQNDDPLASAVVYLKDTRNGSVRTYISNQDGSYQFGGLSRNQDYDLVAEFQGSRSPARTLSSFDSRSAPNINLHIHVKKK